MCQFLIAGLTRYGSALLVLGADHRMRRRGRVEREERRGREEESSMKAIEGRDKS